jgi:L-aspartate oxidase
MKQQSFDIIIVGSGIAGLSTLLYLSETKMFKNGGISICLITKGSLDQTNTNWAQGGIAAVHALGDNFDKHINDTLNAGAFTNNKKIVEKVINAAPSLIDDLIRWGTRFDKNNVNEFELAKEGGHSDARIWHKEDQTGKAIQSALMFLLQKLQNITVVEYTSLVGATKLPNNTFSLNVYDSKSKCINNLFCSKLVLATGGLGMLYDKTTNQQIATGDGVYISHQLGASIENLSFIQFHPTGLYQGGQITYLISEALRGAGAILRNEYGEAFMYKYDESLDLAPRDIVSRAISKEISLQNISYVYLDATHIDTTIINAHFPTIKEECMLRLGLNIEKEYIPVIPVQHYSCGGVKVDEFGESTISGLFAIGEIASTGLHGANRLASNSLLEAIAFAKFAIPKLTQHFEESFNIDIVNEPPRLREINKKVVQQIMSKYAGIVKSKEGLREAFEQLNTLKNTAVFSPNFSIENFEANCILEVAIMLIEDAQNQTSNRGVFYNIDLV